MPIPAAQLDRRVHFLQRQAWGIFATGGLVTWGAFREDTRPRAWTAGGLEFNMRGGTLTVRESETTRTVTPSYRLSIDGTMYEVISVQPPDNGMIRMQISEAPTHAAYQRELAQRGELVTIRRTVANASPITASVPAVITGFTPEEVVAGMQAGARKVLLLHADLVAAGFPVPPRANDRIIQAGPITLTIQSVDIDTHRSGGVQIAYQAVAA